MHSAKTAVSTAIVAVIIVIVIVVGGAAVYVATSKPATTATSVSTSVSTSVLTSILTSTKLSTVTSTGVSTVTTTETTTAKTSSAQVAKIALVTGVPTNNFWTNHLEAGIKASLLALSHKYNFQYEFQSIYNVNPTDSIHVMGTFHDNGYRYFITTVENLPQSAQIGDAFPDSKIAIVYLGPPYPKTNLYGYQDNIDQSDYLGGVLAGMATKSNVVGFVVAFDIPAAAYEYNCFAAGVKSVNPNAKVPYVFVNDWSDASKGAAAADNLIGQGADVISGYGDSMLQGVMVESAKKGVYGIAYIDNLTYLAPKFVMASLYFNSTGTTYKMFRDAIVFNNATNGYYALTIAQHGQDLVLNMALVHSGAITTAEVNAVNQARTGLATGTIKLPQFGLPFPSQ